MYPPEEDKPYHAGPGDRVEHKLMPGFVMTVHETKDCETDVYRSQPHQQYRVTDPEGNGDWVCAYDVRGAP